MGYVQYCGGCSALWRVFSTVEYVQYSEMCSVLRKMLSSVNDAQYLGGGDIINPVGGYHNDTSSGENVSNSQRYHTFPHFVTVA